MSNALVERTLVNISMDNNPNTFTARGEVIRFDGFLKLYIESSDDENGEDSDGILPPVKEGDILSLHQCMATERFSRPPARYSEAALVKKMEELGIGRPSTYAPTISTIIKREYVTKDSKEGKHRDYLQLSLKKSQIREETLSEKYAAEKNKLFPSSTGMIVNDFLIEHFPGIVDYHFTANIENEFDDIASGKKNWSGMIAAFYKDFEPLVKNVSENAQRTKGERFLGTDPASGEKVFAKLGRYGPFVQLGEKEDDKKPKFATLKKGQLIENITLDEALHLLRLPRNLGTYNKQELLVNIGRFGPYVLYEKKFYSIPKSEDPYEITLEKAIEIIELKKEQEKNKTVHVYEHENKSIKVLRGRYGPYISYEANSYKIPKGQDPEKIQLEDALNIIKNTKPAQSKRSTTRKKTAKKQ
jgi:DNA topoisomerase I